VLEIAKVFLKLGTLAFGGPAAHVAMFDHEVVERRGWLSRERFLDLLGATQLIPGPNSTEMAIHVGLLRGGPRGMVAAGLGFVLPATVLSTALAVAYVHLEGLPHFGAVMQGIKPVVVAIIVWALWRLARTAIKGTFSAALAIAAAAASTAAFSPVSVLVAAGLTGVIGARGLRGVELRAVAAPLSAPWAAASRAPWSAPATGVLAVAGGVTGAVTLVGLAAAFLQVGALLYGSGYVLLAFLQDSLVQQRGWLSEPELLDAIAIGQLTPGPVLSTAAFVGYLVAGLPGAAVATAAIFLPSFLYVSLLGPLIPRLRSSPAASAFLDAVNAAVVALIGVVAVRLGATALTSAVSWSLAVLALLALWRGAPPAWLIFGGAVLGWLLL